MAVVRGNLLTSAHAQTFLAGAVRLSGLSTGVTPTQLNQSVPRSAPAARLFGTAAEMARPNRLDPAPIAQRLWNERHTEHHDNVIR